MKKKATYFILVPALAFGILIAAFGPFKGSVREEVMLQMLTGSLSQAHYKPVVYNNDFSEKFLQLYLERLDVNKKFLLKEDVEKLRAYKHKIDDEISQGEFSFFHTSYDLITKRVNDVNGFFREILDKPFDFTLDENIETDSKKLEYSNTLPELKEAWRKALKFQVLNRIVNTIEEKDSLGTTVPTPEEFSEMERNAREKVLKANEDYFRRLTRLNKNDRFNQYLSIIANLHDPHTEFFPPKDKKNFDIQMSGQLEGIGAQLVERDGFIRVSSIVPGSASYKQGELKAGDIILKVGQGNKEPVDITDMRLDDAIELIRGKKGTEVRLTVKKPSGDIKVIPIIRDVVILEETYARSAIVTLGKKKIGLIHLPSFYADFGKSGARNCSRDVKIELEKLKSENVDGVVIDLRNNGGGSLNDVIRMAGLFFGKGPVVQVMQRDRSTPLVYADEDPSIVYGGPLAIMVNENSASASEILAAAIQDYKRGIIIGSKATFGKGTVQQFMNLDDYLMAAFDSLKPLGSVKLTIQKFYRINGGSTQLRGVEPDIILPDVFKYVEEGEKDLNYPLPWDEISKANYAPVKGGPDIQKLKKQSQQRVNKEERFRLIEEWALELKKDRDLSSYSLNFSKFREQEKERKTKYKKYDPAFEEISGMDIITPGADLKTWGTDTIKINRNRDWHKNLKKDPYLMETINIMGDY
jgi:carboxyl-terminal processing protease